MLKFLSFILPSLCFIACKDNPYSPLVETTKENYAFSGIVELGTPISGSAILAHEFAGLKKGKPIGQAISNRDGSFDLKFETNYDGPLLLVAQGGLYRDLATGEMTALKPAQELSSAITHIKMPEKTNINAWTTLAVARVQADKGFWDKSVAELKDIDRINVDFSHLSYFLSGKSSNFINIRRQDFFDIEKDSLVIEEPKVTLHIAHGGLSQLAKHLSAKLASEGLIISVVDLIEVLKEDLSDRVFDGHKSDGSVAYIGNNHRINLNSYTMRRELSGSILLYLKHLQGIGKLAESDRRVFEVPGKIIDSIARDSRPELFPSSDQPKPLDKEAPKITVRFANEHRHQRPFAILEGNVDFEVEADDESGLQSIRMLEPRTTNKESGSVFGSISANHIPQAIIAARMCSKENDLRNELGERDLSEENVICACFEAIDVFDNISKELACFQRAIPQAMISFPTNKTILNNENLHDGFAVKAKISSGLLLKECKWVIRFEEESILSGEGDIVNNDCVVDDLVDGSKFENGNYNFVVQAEDIGGRILNEKESFQAYKEPPAVDVNLLSEKSYLAQDFISFTGTISKPELIKEIRASFRGIEANNNELSGNARAILMTNSNSWAISMGQQLVPGEYAINIVVKDIYDNEKNLPIINIIIDHEKPKIRGSLDGIAQSPYAQETINYRQGFVGAERNPRYIITPIEKGSAINWNKTPVINRWLGRIDDASTAPGYTFEVSDDNVLKEIKYKIGNTCAPLDETGKTIAGQDGRYDIRFVQSNINFDFAQNNQKHCLSIWAIDQAGNASNHTVEFIWKTIASPLAIDMNAARYRAYRREDDISWVGPPVWSLFKLGSPIVLRKNLVIGHAIISNPFASGVSARLKLDNALDLSIGQRQYYVPKNIIDVRYFAYDLAKDEIGLEKTLTNGSVIVNGGETIISKFILAKELAITGIENPDNNFWQTFSLKLAFAKNGHGQAVVDGLTLITKDPEAGQLSNEYVVPWGNDHDVRRRSALQVIYP